MKYYCMYFRQFFTWNTPIVIFKLKYKNANVHVLLASFKIWNTNKSYSCKHPPPPSKILAFQDYALKTKYTIIYIDICILYTM